MSGPKVSVYELTAEERKIFYEQLEILKQTEVNLQQVFKGMANLQNEINTLEGSIAKGKLLAEQTKCDCDFSAIQSQIDTILKKIEICEKEYARIKEEYRVDKAGYVKMSQEMHRERAAKLKALQELNASINEQVRLVKSLQKEALEKVEKIDESLKEELQEQILGGFAISFAGVKREIKSLKCEASEEPSAEEIEAKRQENLARLRSYQDKIFAVIVEISDEVGSPDRLSPILSEKLRAIQCKATEISSVDFIENFYAISVTPFVKECKEYITLLKEFDEAYMRYEFLCDEMGIVAKKYAITKENIMLISEEIEKLEAEDAEAKTKAFIAKAIDEAMHEMGYDCVGHREVTKKSGKVIKHELYHFGDGTGVDVTFSGDGQITMELGGFDSQNRTPNESESDRLVEDMQHFCGDYAALERLLEQKGVKRRNIQMFPPTKEFAQIFCTEDYEMVKPVQKLEVKKKQQGAVQAKHAE